MDFVLVPGAGGSGWYWHRVVEQLAGQGHHALPVDLPAQDPEAGLPEYCDRIVAAVEAVGRPVTLVAQSLAGFSAPLACAQVPVDALILINAMIPAPGETAGEWWDHVGWRAAAEASAARDGRPQPDLSDPEALFFHDLPADVVEVMRANPDAAAQAPTVFGQPWPLDAWPPVLTTVLSARDDRLFPLSLQRRVAQERLGLPVDELPGGHLVALSQPVALAERVRLTHGSA